MATAGSANRLLNYYDMISEITCPALDNEYEGITVEIPINIGPLYDAWHYLGIVVAEVKGDAVEQDRAVR